jgi:ribosomal protein S18 acetylase RimI-like enzyme
MASDNRMIRIRLALVEDASAIARVNVRSWQRAYRGILPDSFLDALEPSLREGRWREALGQQSLEGRFTYVAEQLAGADGLSAEIIGFASGGPERDGLLAGGIAYDGEVYALYLAPGHERRGYGRRLLAASAEQMVESGKKSIVIWALKENREARAFYKALGGVLAAEKTVTIGPSNLLDVAYGWPDARVLVTQVPGPLA